MICDVERSVDEKKNAGVCTPDDPEKPKETFFFHKRGRDKEIKRARRTRKKREGMRRLREMHAGQALERCVSTSKRRRWGRRREEGVEKENKAYHTLARAGWRRTTRSSTLFGWRQIGAKWNGLVYSPYLFPNVYTQPSLEAKHIITTPRLTVCASLHPPIGLNLKNISLSSNKHISIFFL